MSHGDVVDSVLVIDAVNVYSLCTVDDAPSNAPSISVRNGLGQLRPNNPEGWRRLREVNPRSLLLLAIGHSLDSQSASDADSVGASLGIGACDIDVVAPGVSRIRSHDLEIYQVDLLGQLVALYPDHLAVAVGDSSITMLDANTTDIANSRRSVLPGVADIQPLVGLMNSDECQGASAMALDGCLSVLNGEGRTIVGVSATTTIDSMVAAAIFDRAASIFRHCQSTSYAIVGWTRETPAIAADLATLGGEPVLLVDPLTVLWNYDTFRAVRFPRNGADVPIQPRGSQRLLRRIFADWQRLAIRAR